MKGTEMQIAKKLDRGIQEVPEEDRARIEMAVASIAAIFDFLRDFGYSLEKVEMSNNLLKYQTSVVWRNPRIEREVSVSYLPYDYEGQESNTLNVSIVKLSSTRKGNDVFDASEQFMNLRMYLESKCPDFDTSVLSSLNYEGGLEERVKKVLRAYAYYMQDVAENILRGEDWETGHFHSWH